MISPLVLSRRAHRAAAFALLATTTLAAAGCRTSGAPAATPAAPAVAATPASQLYDPARDLGPLFHDVQMAGVLPDSKTFVDARPLLAPAEVAARYAAAKDSEGFALKDFVARWFELPRPAGGDVRRDSTLSMEEHIRALWPVLTRAADRPDPRSSLIPLPNAQFDFAMGLAGTAFTLGQAWLALGDDKYRDAALATILRHCLFTGSLLVNDPAPLLRCSC